MFNLDFVFLKFLLVGVLNTSLSLLIIFSLKFFLALDDLIANVVGYFAGLICSFLLNKKWTFQHSGDTLIVIFKFFAVFIVAYCVNLIIVLMLLKTGINSYFAHIMGMPVYTVIFFIGSKFFAFK